jgi:serine/threonine-protein kinase RsbW
MTPWHELECAAQMNCLDGLRDYVERFVAAHAEAAPAAAGAAPDRVTQAAGLRLMLVLEELFTNTVQHGHGGGSDAAVHVALAVRDGVIVLRYEDHGVPFDPVAQGPAAAAELARDADARPIGHMGLMLVLEMSEHAHYTRDGTRNQLTLHLAASV